MEALIEFVTQHVTLAPWFIFGAILLAGFNIPISVDLLVIISAILAATVAKEQVLLFYFTFFFGCLFSAWIAYWVGRLLGKKLIHVRWFKKLLSPEKIEKVRVFYEKRGLLTLLIGRFIPFGVRNVIFMSSGISKIPFKRFALYDLLACFVWSSTLFSLFYYASQNYQTLYGYMKTFNILIFSLFAVAVIGFIWYKRRKKPAPRDA